MGSKALIQWEWGWERGATVLMGQARRKQNGPPLPGPLLPRREERETISRLSSGFVLVLVLVLVIDSGPFFEHEDENDRQQSLNSMAVLPSPLPARSSRGEE